MTARPAVLHAIDLAAVFLASAGTLVLEIAAARSLAPHVGLTLHVWTGVIASVLAGMTIGHWLGGRLARNDARAARGQVGAAFAAASVAALATVGLVPWLAAVLPDGRSPWTIGALSLPFLPPALFAGIVAPVLTSLAVDDAKRGMGRTFGRLYATSAVGGVTGALATGFVLLGWFGLVEIVVGVAACFAAMASLMALTAPRKRMLETRRSAT